MSGSMSQQTSIRVDNELIRRADEAAARVSRQVGVEVARATILRSAVNLGLERLEARHSRPQMTEQQKGKVFETVSELLTDIGRALDSAGTSQQQVRDAIEAWGQAASSGESIEQIMERDQTLRLVIGRLSAAFEDVWASGVSGAWSDVLSSGREG